MNWLRNNLLTLVQGTIILVCIGIGIYIKMEHWNECKLFHGNAYCLFLRKF